jgi:hypothetical protein
MAALFQHGEPYPVQVPVALAKAVNRGDITGVNSSGLLVKASEQAYDTNEATTRANFVAQFGGLSAQSKTANEPVAGNQGSGTIRVDSDGVHRMNIKSGTTAKIGDWVGPTYVSATTSLRDDEVQVVTVKAGTIGVIVGLPYGATGPEVLVRIFSVKLGERALGL